MVRVIGLYNSSIIENLQSRVQCVKINETSGQDMFYCVCVYVSLTMCVQRVVQRALVRGREGLRKCSGSRYSGIDASDGITGGVGRVVGSKLEAVQVECGLVHCLCESQGQLANVKIKVK